MPGYFDFQLIEEAEVERMVALNLTAKTVRYDESRRHAQVKKATDFMMIDEEELRVPRATDKYDLVALSN